MPQVLPSGPLSGAASSVPPDRLFALPIDEIVTSIVWPGRPNAGSSAVSITAATFFIFMFGRIDVLPSRFNIFVSAVFTTGDNTSSPRTVEADDDAEPGEVVVANAFDRREVLDPIGVRRLRDQQRRMRMSFFIRMARSCS